MIRLDIAVLALALGVTAVACGGSEPPAKDPSSDPAATMPAAPENTPPPPAPSAAPSMGLGGTGTPAAQGAGAAH
jgi:hypothetical protein